MLKKLFFYNIFFLTILFSKETLTNNINKKITQLSKTNNYTNELQRLINSQNEVFIKEGEYYLDLNKITIPKNIKIYGEGIKTKIYTKNKLKFNSKIMPSSIFTSKNLTKIHISKLSFFSMGNNSYVFKTYSDKKTYEPSLKIDNISAYGLGLVWVGPKNGFTYNRPVKEINYNWYENGPIKKVQVTNNIEISNNYIKGDKKFTVGSFNRPSSSAITLLYVNNAKIENNEISNFRFGIWAYGGATRTNSKKRTTTNEIMCSNINITNNTVFQTYSPYWVSKCSKVSINDNFSLNNQDVAVDFEGSINCIAKNNTIINSKGGALVALNSSKNIAFLNNIVVTKKMNRNTNIVLIRDGNQNITYKDNIFFYEQSYPFDYSRIFLKNSSGLIEINKNISFVNNKFYNTIIESRGSNIKNINNTFYNKNILKKNIYKKLINKDKND